MPRRRTTRNKSKRPGPTIPSGDEGSSIDVECRKEKVKTLIQDFENEGCILSRTLLYHNTLHSRRTVRPYLH